MCCYPTRDYAASISNLALITAQLLFSSVTKSNTVEMADTASSQNVCLARTGSL